MRRCKVKYWKTVKDGLDLQTALNMYRAQEVEGRQYDYLAIKLGYQIFEPGYLSKDEKFTIEEALSNKWELIVPDDNKEQILFKTREIVKAENFLRVSHERIDNMNISDIWNEMNNILINLDYNSKYRLIEHIIENKLYKKA